ARTSEATRVRKKYPGDIPVIMEKYVHSHVPKLRHRQRLSPNLTLGVLKQKIRENLNLDSEKAIFVFVNNTLPPADALMSEIDEEHKDEDGFLYMTYGGEDIITDL
ncbi:hypothetical protein CARUB_v10006628mg, partial [Capsella rubella]